VFSIVSADDRWIKTQRDDDSKRQNNLKIRGGLSAGKGFLLPRRPDSPVSSEDKLRERVSKLGKKYETSDDVRNDIVDLGECELHSTS
jgi:hypothetical protein